MEIGHLLRAGKFPEPTEHIITDVVIAGGGVAGLSAARVLSKNQHIRYLLIDLHNEPGGNSRAGENRAGAYPLAAHYLPIPEISNKALIDFLFEADLIREFASGGIPVYKDEYLCSEPKERLFIHGIWQEGLIPWLTLSDQDRSQVEAFLASMEKYRQKKGRDGKYWFTIPCDESSSDQESRELDSINMEDWMLRNEFTSKPLHWYVNYCCRDDYGSLSRDTSAWAGIHYFAGRRGQAFNASSDEILTWPEGNQFLVNKLSRHIAGDLLKLNCIVYSIEPSASGWEIQYFDAISQRSTHVTSKYCIDALPVFTHKYIRGPIWKSLESIPAELTYSPWMVANMKWQKPPEKSAGAPLSWDNVLMNDQSLGYINSSHQHLTGYPQEINLTYYLPLCHDDPSVERKRAFMRTEDEWFEQLQKEVEPVHPGFSQYVSEIEFTLWGHAMCRPTPGSIWTHRLRRKSELDKLPGILFAHSDHSGISIFEEAFHQGYTAAQKVIQRFS